MFLFYSNKTWFNLSFSSSQNDFIVKWCNGNLNWHRYQPTLPFQAFSWRGLLIKYLPAQNCPHPRNDTYPYKPCTKSIKLQVFGWCFIEWSKKSMHPIQFWLCKNPIGLYMITWTWRKVWRIYREGVKSLGIVGEKKIYFLNDSIYNSHTRAHTHVCVREELRKQSQIQFISLDL